jgi:fatty-acyl-CoA synthase
MMISTDWIDKWAKYNPGKIALKELESGREVTYQELNRLGNNLSTILKEKHSFEKGDRFAILSENNIEYIVLFSVAQKLGITLVPLNYRLTSTELDYIIGNAEVRGILFDVKFLEKVSNLDSFNKIPVKYSIASLRDLNHDCLACDEGWEPVKNLVLEDDPLFILYTSGTTAFPKGALYTHRMLFWNSINTELRLDLNSEDVSINCAPPFHTGGWNVLITPFIHHGAYTLLVESFDPDIILEMLEKEKATIWWAVPTMLKMMADSPVFNKVKLDKLRYFVVGGESMPIPLIEKWHRKGVLIRQGYGLTEVGPNVSSLDHKDAIRKKGSIGTMNFYYDAMLVDSNSKPVDTGEIGELVLRGPTVTPGYWKNEEATRNAIREGWFHTGDLMRVDDEGYYYVVDRIKNMYISGGENVYPAEVEHMLLTHPSIAEVAIVGVPDEKWGETGMACVVLKKGSDLNHEEFFDFCLQRVAKYKAPKHLKILDELPKNEAGKIDRKKLQKLYT